MCDHERVGISDKVLYIADEKIRIGRNGAKE